MSQLIVRQVKPGVVRALKARAARHGRSAEAEHRLILESALKSEHPVDDFKAFLLAVPAEPAVRFPRSRDRGRVVKL